ncbi:hypothetical protein VYU27_006852 [Nannochloropsis oceanica]
MTNICIGPFCVPLGALIPFLFVLFRVALSWFKDRLGAGSPEEQALAAMPRPPAVNKRTWTDSSIVHITDVAHLAKIRAQAREAGVPVVIDFTATWCGPCRTIAPVFEELSQQYNAAFLKVDIDEADDVAQAFAIRSMPTFVFLRPKDGLEEEIRFSGANKPKLEGLVRATCAAVVRDGTEEEDKKSK